MDIRNLITQAIFLSIALLAFQRTIPKRRWLTGLLFLLPAAVLFWRWSIFNDRLPEYFAAAGITLAVNGLFWLFYGRRFPPGSKGEIKVIGSED